VILLFACTRPDADPDPPLADAVIHGTHDATAMPQAIAIADVTGDGPADVVAGGGYRNQTCVFAGPILDDRAWSDGTCWESEAAGDLSGFALATGDLDGDGRTDLAIGAPLAAAGGFERGRAYLVPAPDAPKVSLSTASYVFSGDADLDSFGISVLVVDANADGTSDLLVGAVGNDDGGPGAGQVYIFAGPLVAGPHAASEASATLLGFGPHQRHASSEPGDGVGFAMSAPGDIDGDGLGDLLVGAGGHDDPATDAGIAALYFAPVPWGRYGLLASDVTFTGAAASAWLGEPSGGSDDLDGDGYREVLLGSSGEQLGHVYRYEGPFAGGAVAEPDAVGAWIGDAPFDGVGVSFLGPGDVDGDGHSDALVAAAYADNGSGSVGLFLGPLPDGPLHLDDADRRWIGEADASLGRVLAAGEIDGDPGLDLAIGAPSYEDGGTIRLFFGD
jgi:hypothetical protein